MSLTEAGDVVTGITLMLGMVTCAIAGFIVMQQMARWRTWPWTDGLVYGTTAFLNGMVFLHIGLSRMYDDEQVWHLWDLNSVWTAVIRTAALAGVVVSGHRLMHPEQ